MNRTIKKRHDTYHRIDGYLLGWERGEIGKGHKATIIDSNGSITTFTWKSPKEPIAGDQVTIVMPEKGDKARFNRPILILNHTTGDRHAEINGDEPKSTRNIMLWLGLWVVIAMGIATAICYFATIFQAKVVILLAAALCNWRLAIATRDIKNAERTAQRNLDEESVRSQVALEVWQENPSSRLPRIDLQFDAAGPIKQLRSA